MKSVCLFWMAVLGVFAISEVPAVAQDYHFVLENQTGYAILGLFLSPSGEDNWQEDVLGADMLPHGKRIRIKFSPGERTRFWDLKVYLKNGESPEWRNLDLSRMRGVILYYEEGEATAQTLQ